jgi:hypothetical protein
MLLSGSGSGAGSYTRDVFFHSLSLYDSGTATPGSGNRNYFDINGNAIEQSFYPTVTAQLCFNHTLSTEQKRAINQLRSIYFSSSFYKVSNFNSSSLATNPSSLCHVLSISNVLIGSKIKPGSFSLGPIVDDSYGGLYSGSVLVGCIFYEYGTAFFGKDTTQSTFTNANNSISMSFSATVHTPMNVYICEAPKSHLNFSTNPSYSVLSGTKYEITTETPQTFITTIMLYDEDFELVGVAKKAVPVRNQESDGIQFRLKLNF